MSDMGCHCRVGWYALTPPDKPVNFLQPVSVSADLALLKWGQPHWRQAARQIRRRLRQNARRGLCERHRHLSQSETGQRVRSQFSVSWMFDKQGMRLSLEGLGAGYGST